mgnify:CR=1 FL=1
MEDQRQVTKEQGEDKANKLEVAFLETSAFSGENLEKAFELMMKEVYKKCHEEMLGDGDVDIIKEGTTIGCYLDRHFIEKADAERDEYYASMAESMARQLKVEADTPQTEDGWDCPFQ